MKLLQRLPVASAVVSTILLLCHQSLAADVPPLSSISNGGANPQTSAAASSSSSGAKPSTGNTSPTAVVITGSTAATTTQSVPVIITGGATATTGGLTGLPKIPGAYTIAPASVPPTANAPFMRTSNLPEGTVFIAVGSVLGFMAFIVLGWRGLAAWSLRRAVKRAAMHQNMAEAKALFRQPSTPLYNYADRESSTTLVASKGNRKSRPPPPLPGGVPPQSLFFSPTAGVANASMLNQGNRGSNYLPAGYYAAGAAAPGNGHGLAHIGTGNQPRESISMTNLDPQSRAYARPKPSPPESLDMQQPRDEFMGHRAHPSTSSIPPPRAPSAFLEEMFDDSTRTSGQFDGHGGR